MQLEDKNGVPTAITVMRADSLHDLGLGGRFSGSAAPRLARKDSDDFMRLKGKTALIKGAASAGGRQLTASDKEKILGFNIAKIFGIDIEAKKRELGKLPVPVSFPQSPQD